MEKRRVVITGLGAVSPIGNTKEEILLSVKNSKHGIGKISKFDTEDFKVKLAGEVKDLDWEDYLSKKEKKRLDLVSCFGLVAAGKALEDSRLDLDQIDRNRIGVYMSSGIGGLKTIEEEAERGQKYGFEKLSPFFIPKTIINLLGSNIAVKYGLHGSCLSPVTACAGSSTSIGEAFRAIKDGYLDWALAGGSEASITKLGIGGFSSMRALSTSQDPDRASIPFDRERDGFVMGEGAGVLILEDLEKAQARGAYIYGEVLGYGASCDGEHITAPNKEGTYASRAMDMAVREGGLSKSQIGYINAHGTSTQLNDMAETKAIKKSFPNYQDIYVSSSKSMTGHLLSASGVVEAIVSLLALEEGLLPPNVNYREKDPACDLNIVANQAKKASIDYFLSNSFGFGGHNVSVLFGRGKF